MYIEISMMTKMRDAICFTIQMSGPAKFMILTVGIGFLNSVEALWVPPYGKPPWPANCCKITALSMILLSSGEIK